MTSDFWNERYSGQSYVYGTEPNEFIKSYIDSQHPGKILLPAEGEGRNAVYASKHGWYVEAFDSSKIACDNAFKLAKTNQVKISYTVEDLMFYTPKPDFFNVVGVSFLHLPRLHRKFLSVKMWESLRIGGRIVMEVFSHEQLQFQSGGPKDIALLYSEQEIKEDFSCFRVETLTTLTIELNEGAGHTGKASVVRFIGVK